MLSTRVRFFCVHLSVPCLIAWVVAGCALTREPYEPVQHYDLQCDTPSSTDFAVVAPSIEVTPFQRLGPQGTRMIYRREGNRVKLDEYHRWILPPEDLISRDITVRLMESGLFTRVDTLPTPDAPLQLQGVLLALEVTTDGKARLELRMSVYDRTSDDPVLNRFFRQEEPLSEPSPTGFAQTASGMVSRVLAEFTDQLARVLSNSSMRE